MKPKKYLKFFAQVLTVFMPWSIKRFLLVNFFKYNIHPKAHIGISWVFPKKLFVESGATISSFTFFREIEEVHLDHSAKIGSFVFITGFPKGVGLHYINEKSRFTSLRLGNESHITSRHLIDCTNKVEIGDFTTIAGYRTQILTHAIDLTIPMQRSAPVTIGNYCFISTSCIILPGVNIPDYCVLAAGSVVVKSLTKSNSMYGGVPAHFIKDLPYDYGFFVRKNGKID